MAFLASWRFNFLVRLSFAACTSSSTSQCSPSRSWRWRGCCRAFTSAACRSAIVVAIVFSLLNFFLGWLIKVVLFVPAILTLGLLFLIMPFIVNTILLWLTDKLLSAFEIDSFGSLLVSSLVITLVNGAFHIALHPHDLPNVHPAAARRAGSELCRCGAREAV